MADPIVELQSGLVRGVVEKHEDGFNYYAFRGIPYAEPPVGELRFEDPVPIQKWKKTLDCKNYTPPCLQYDLFIKMTSYNEDCLYLSIFSRTIGNPNMNSPVMMLVHGGAFTFGSADDTFYGPEYLMRKDVVFVKVNYRLGVLGFLDLEDEIAPGNQGLKDLVLALQWIQQNIRGFGGNPDNVTLFGAGAGGAAVHYLTVSPLTKGLIHKVISQCSTLFCPWAGISGKESPKSNAIKLCSILGKTLTDSREIVQYLKTVDAKSLQEAQEKLRNVVNYLPFSPGRDNKSSRPVMPIHRYIAAEEQGIHLPYLLGYNAEEGIAVLSDVVSFPGKTRSEFFQQCNTDFGTLYRRYNIADLLDRYDLTLTQMRRLYFKNEPMTNDNLDKFVECSGDAYFTEGIHRLAKVLVERNSASTYLYKFSFDTTKSLVKTSLENVPRGACHLDELPFLFKMRAFKDAGIEHFKKGSKEYQLMEQMTTMWTNFATYGRPTIDISDLTPVHWKPVSDGTLLRYLNLDEDITMQHTVNVVEKFVSAKNIKD